jgi:hypothetical protein
MTLDISGRPAPPCRYSANLIRAAVARIPENTWGKIGGWRCIWELPSAAVCRRQAVRIYADNPGD